VKFTGNPYSYVCERLPLKYTQTRVCWNLYMRTRTVPDSYSCLCECSLKFCHCCSSRWMSLLLAMRRSR